MLTRRFQSALMEDRRIRARRAGEDIKALMLNNQVREPWSKTKGWYREAKGQRFPPTRDHVDKTSTLWEELYRHCPPEGEIIPILVQPLSIEDGPPELG